MRLQDATLEIYSSSLFPAFWYALPPPTVMRMSEADGFKIDFSTILCLVGQVLLLQCDSRWSTRRLLQTSLQGLVRL